MTHTHTHTHKLNSGSLSEEYSSKQQELPSDTNDNGCVRSVHKSRFSGAAGVPYGGKQLPAARARPPPSSGSDHLTDPS